MIAQNLAAVRARIEAAARNVGRDAAGVTLVAVTKEVDAAVAREAVALGLVDLGENRVKELLKKQEALPGPDVRWHMIGTLQRNKVVQVVGRVGLIHSVDSVSLGEAIAGRAQAQGIRQGVLLEVNAGEERQKHGVAPSEAEEAARGLLDMTGLRLRGLMTVAPQGDLDAARRAFRTLRELRDAIKMRAEEAIELSMGMTDDFEVAIEEGATIVRIGTAIFGARETSRRKNDQVGKMKEEGSGK
ncbi:MAG: YggS family pyridoxal phosphate-dependent enzyme [Actinobacteria bacterium]|nr:MAG: YggS family pyridoxal phosphate-dependent enzyme [Actinomycetota bacterium]